MLGEKGEWEDGRVSLVLLGIAGPLPEGLSSPFLLCLLTQAEDLVASF